MSRRSTPYDGTQQLFRIGVRPLGDADWFDIDDELAAYLDEKARLAATERVFVASPGTEAAQAEALAMIAGWLPARHPAIYRRDGQGIDIIGAGRRVELSDAATPPLALAAALVQDDLVLMRRGDSGWWLAAGSLCFPSSWSLAEKFGLPIDRIHAPVPGFGTGTRNAELIARMLDKLRPETPVLRWNVSLYPDTALRHAETAPPNRPRFGDGPVAENVVLRLERQTLRRLPASGDILFGIRIYVDSLETMARRPEAPRLAAALAEQLAALEPAQLAYKGMGADRERLLARLALMAGTEFPGA